MVDLPDVVKDPAQQTTLSVIGLSYSTSKGNLSDQSGNISDKSPYIIEENVSTSIESLGSNNSLSSVISIKTNDDTRPSDPHAKAVLQKEKWWSITIQVAIPFIIAGFGTIGAGVVLGKVQDYVVFKEVGNLIILVPPILGLKGNLDMCLASRLSTQANLGNMSQSTELCKMIVGNIAIVQVQAIVAAVLVSVFAVTVGYLVSDNVHDDTWKMFQEAILLIVCSILTATVSCFFLDFVMIGVIFISQKIKMNPDNVATPLAASIGDIVSLTLLSAIASAIYSVIDTYFWTLFVVLAFYICILLPTWIVVVRHNKYTSPVLTSGWLPVISALVISGMGGLVLDKAVGNYRGFVVFQPIINGIGGNLVSVQASRISTMLHKSSIIGILPPHTKQWVAPWTALFHGVYSAKTARILILMALPGQTIFVFIADYFYKWTSTVNAVFVVTYLAVGLFQIMILLYICHILVHTMWKYKIDPDNSSIPYLTSLGDFLGSSLLLLAFMFLRYTDYEYESNNLKGR